ncbi:MAG: dihydropteroate synthase [Chitinophagaceae bacterium]|nr:dihydropteroate synthase [Chitinophagaceae bacterium]
MFTLNCKGRLLVVDKPLVMGIINVTPDSFYEGSRFEKTDCLLKQAEQMLKEGADILDLGGQSTRPGSERVTAGEELRRLAAPIENICREFPETYISVDTYYSEVAKEAVGAGACMVNDISAGSIDPQMIPVVASLRVPYILMHMKGQPGTMQQEPRYDNVTKEILDFFIFKTTELKKAGIHDLIIDPGFGFGKTIQHNFEILKNSPLFKMLQLPVLAGLSRKSSIYKTLKIPVGESLNGTSILNTIALMNGADILRVHDVKEAKQAITLFEKYSRA